MTESESQPISESRSIVNLGNLGDLSKPANTLIEKISDAIGGVFHPYQIRRVADAKAYADKLEATTEIEIEGLRRRAVERFLAEEAKKQQNIESIAGEALGSVRDSAKPENIDDDWITNFFDRCKLVSDSEMQELWSAVLAGEANAPGNFSKRTVNALADLDKSDATLFQTLCGFCVNLGAPTPLVYEPKDDAYTKHGITFESLTHLDAIGLVRFESLSAFKIDGLQKSGQVRYFDESFWVEFPGDPPSFTVGKVLLTQVGRQLASVVNARPHAGFVDYLKTKLVALKCKTDPNAATSGGKSD